MGAARANIVAKRLEKKWWNAVSCGLCPCACCSI